MQNSQYRNSVSENLIEQNILTLHDHSKTTLRNLFIGNSSAEHRKIRQSISRFYNAVVKSQSSINIIPCDVSHNLLKVVKRGL